MLLSTKDTPKQKVSKLKKIWQGPFQVIDILGRNVYKVVSLTKKEYIVHASRLWFYYNKEY